MIQLRTVIGALGWSTMNVSSFIPKLAEKGVTPQLQPCKEGGKKQTYMIPTDQESLVREVLGVKGDKPSQASSKISNKVPAVLLQEGETGYDLLKRFQNFVGKSAKLKSEIQQLEQRCVSKDNMITTLSNQLTAVKNHNEQLTTEMHKERHSTRQLKELFDSLGVE